jgi:hypothetical protein
VINVFFLSIFNALIVFVTRNHWHVPADLTFPSSWSRWTTASEVRNNPKVRQGSSGCGPAAAAAAAGFRAACLALRVRPLPRAAVSESEAPGPRLTRARAGVTVAICGGERLSHASHRDDCHRDRDSDGHSTMIRLHRDNDSHHVPAFNLKLPGRSSSFKLPAA